jgi:hypothetical protein
MIGLGSNFCTSVPPHIFGSWRGLGIGVSHFHDEKMSEGSKVFKSVFGSL